MSKINKVKTINIVIFALGILAILAIGLMLMPNKASAYQDSAVTPYNATRYNYPVVRNDTYIVEDTRPPQVVYTNTPPTYANRSETVNSTTTTENTNIYRENNQSNQNYMEENSVSDDEQSLNGIAANAVYGSGFQMGLIHWVFLAILVLAIVILVRKIFGAEDRYHSTPLKHA